MLHTAYKYMYSITPHDVRPLQAAHVTTVFAWPGHDLLLMLY